MGTLKETIITTSGGGVTTRTSEGTTYTPGDSKTTTTINQDGKTTVEENNFPPPYKQGEWFITSNSKPETGSVTIENKYTKLQYLVSKKEADVIISYKETDPEKAWYRVGFHFATTDYIKEFNPIKGETRTVKNPDPLPLTPPPVAVSIQKQHAAPVEGIKTPPTAKSDSVKVEQAANASALTAAQEIPSIKATQSSTISTVKSSSGDVTKVVDAVRPPSINTAAVSYVNGQSVIAASTSAASITGSVTGAVSSAASGSVSVTDALTGAVIGAGISGSVTGALAGGAIGAIASCVPLPSFSDALKDLEESLSGILPKRKVKFPKIPGLDSLGDALKEVGDFISDAEKEFENAIGDVANTINEIASAAEKAANDFASDIEKELDKLTSGAEKKLQSIQKELGLENIPCPNIIDSNKKEAEAKSTAKAELEKETNDIADAKIASREEALKKALDALDKAGIQYELTDAKVPSLINIKEQISKGKLPKDDIEYAILVDSIYYDYIIWLKNNHKETWESLCGPLTWFTKGCTGCKEALKHPNETPSKSYYDSKAKMSAITPSANTAPATIDIEVPVEWMMDNPPLIIKSTDILTVKDKTGTVKEISAAEYYRTVIHPQEIAYEEEKKAKTLGTPAPGSTPAPKIEVISSKPMSTPGVPATFTDPKSGAVYSATDNITIIGETGERKTMTGVEYYNTVVVTQQQADADKRHE